MLHKVGFMLLAILVAAPIASATAATTVVHVELNDPSGDPSLNGMVIKIDNAKVSPGKVTFDVKNLSKKEVHEMIVVAVSKPDQKLPYDELTDRVVEDKIKDLGEASDMPAGTSKTLSLTLPAGNYMLICNQQSHFHKGMKTNFLVAK